MKIENVKNVLQHGQPEFNIGDVVLLSDDYGSFDTSIKYVVVGIEWIVDNGLHNEEYAYTILEYYDVSVSNSTLDTNYSSDKLIYPIDGEDYEMLVSPVALSELKGVLDNIDHPDNPDGKTSRV